MSFFPINAVSILKGSLQENAQLYHIIGEDSGKNQVGITFKCKPNYSESIDKALSRLVPVVIIIPEKENQEIPAESGEQTNV